VNSAIPILMYHAIAEQPAAATRTLSVQPGMFAAQLALLQQQRFTTVTFSQLGAAVRGHAVLPARPIVLTFDDGYADFHREALPVLIRYDCVATLFVTTGWIADAGQHAAGIPLDRMLSWDQIDEVCAAGFEVAAHSHSHAELDQLSDSALRNELSMSKILLEDRLGQEVSALAYPYGYSSPRVTRAVNAVGYRSAATVSNALATTRPQADLFCLPRLTVRRSTNLDTFQRIIIGQSISRVFLTDRALTAGWSVIRRSRYAISRVRHHG
jgi:peptidoglycan/xylan/chitin deacetylase (PgdA/CDA1 family)